MTNYKQAQAAKSVVSKTLKGNPFVSGIGLAKEGDVYHVVVNFTELTPTFQELPEDVDGVRVVPALVGDITAS